MSDFFDDMNNSESKGQSMKASEITGERFLFHSLPKEFQDLHTNDFILEQRGELDANKTSKAVLNGYMWQTISDASLYGVVTSIGLIFAIIKLKLAPDLFGFFITLLIYLPWLFYTIYHFTFYALIRAQVVGPVTEAIKKNTTDTFYTTFGAIVGSVTLAFLVFLSFLKDIAELLATMAVKLNDSYHISGMININIKQYLVIAHNFIADLLNGPENVLGQALFNEWISAFLFLGLTASTIYFFEKEAYEKHKEKMELEIKKAKTASGYPIESALECLWQWRKDNGV